MWRIPPSRRLSTTSPHSRITIMKHLTIIYCSLSVLVLHGVTAQKIKNNNGTTTAPKNSDSLIPSDSLFSAEEEETTDNYRQFLPPQFHPQFPQNIPQFQSINPAFHRYPPYPQLGYVDPQQVQNQQQFQQQSYADPDLLNIQQSSSSNRKTNKQGSSSKKRRKRPQKIENEDTDGNFGPPPDFSQITGYQVQLPEIPKRIRKKKRPQRVQEDYDIDGDGIINVSDLHEPNRSVKKQLKKKVEPEHELGDVNSKTIEGGDGIEGDERACPVNTCIFFCKEFFTTW